MSKTYEELGQIMLNNYSADAISESYDIAFPYIDLALVGGTALLFGDINRDGRLT